MTSVMVSPSDVCDLDDDNLLSNAEVGDQQE